MLILLEADNKLGDKFGVLSPKKFKTEGGFLYDDNVGPEGALCSGKGQP